MKKKLLFVLVPMLIFVFSIAAAIHVHALSADTVDITVALPDTLKVGQSWSGVTPEISASGTVRDEATGMFVNLTAGSEVYLSANGYVQKNNTVYVTFYLCADTTDGAFSMLPEPSTLSFTVNGNELPSDRVMKEMTDSGECYRVECEVSADLSSRTTYSISYSNEYISPNCQFNLPREAEAGISIPFDGSALYTDIPAYEIVGYKANDAEIFSGSNFTMPAENVVIGLVVEDLYEGWQNVPSVNVTLDFDNDDIFYGKRVPTKEEFLSALSATVPVQGATVSFVEDYTSVEVLSDDYNGDALPWAGNIMLSFQISLSDGYLFGNPYLDPMSDDGSLEQWLEDNLTVKVNGKETFFMRAPEDNYADGYFVSEYYCSGNNIEIHIFWYGDKELKNLDLSDYEAGDTVTIPDSIWVWDGYMPTGYTLSYLSPENGETLDFVYGKSFVMPEADGPVLVKAQYIRGTFKQIEGKPVEHVAIQQSKDSDEHISLDIKEGTFSDVTVLQINKINEEDFYGGGYEILDLVNNTLSDVANDSVTFEITALSYNEKVQPSKKIIVTFPIPEGFDSDYIAFYHVDKNGTYEIVPAEIDRENGVCRAVIEHFSTYVIASTIDDTPYEEHIIHQTEKVSASEASCIKDGNIEHYKCTVEGCGKLFADEEASDELSASEAVVSKDTADHTDKNNDNLCDVCSDVINAETGDTAAIFAAIALVALLGGALTLLKRRA